MLAVWFTRQLLFDGAVNGVVFGLVAMGIVLIYRSTRVINFAVANLGMAGTGLFVLLHRAYGVPFWIAALVGLFVGVLFGAIVELTVIRRLFAAPRVIVLVATIGIAQLATVVLIALPDLKPGSKFPLPIGAAHQVAGVRIKGPQLAVLLVVPVVAVALGWVINRTALGRAVKASADNPDMARLSGISPKVVSTAVWAIAGLLATISLNLLAGVGGNANDLNTLGPATMVRALAAAVIAGMVSFPRAFGAGIVIGVAQAIVAFRYTRSPGLFDFIVFLIVLVAVYRRSRTGVTEARTFSYAAKVRQLPEHLRDIWWLRSLDRIGMLLLALGAVMLPIIVTQPSRHLIYTFILTFTICALSLTVLTGWAGQLSLSQMAFAGIGAYLTAQFVHGIDFDLRVGTFRLVKAGIQPVPFAVAIVLAVAITAGIAALVGSTALRIQGLYLAVTTFAFGLAASQYLYRRPILNGHKSGTVTFKRSKILGIDVHTQRAYFYVVLVVTFVTVAAVAKLRRTGIARTTIAVRDNPDTAAAYTISAAKVKLRAFALGGGLAALGGALLGANLQQIPPEQFATSNSLLVVAAAVIGGIGSVGGAVLGAAWIVGLPALAPHNQIVPLLTSSIGLLVLLMYFPGGFVQVGHAGRDAIVRFVERRRPPAPPKQRQVAPQLSTRRDRPVLADGVPALRATEVSVRFGGIVAVDQASIEVAPGEVVGLIGTNGAGKSTMMNAIGGFVPARGGIELFGARVDDLPASGRAARGLGRTFQAAALFPELTVRETVMVALEARRRTGSTIGALISPAAARRERTRRSDAADIVDFLGLGRYADIHIADLSTGTRRIVELAGLIALDARLLCLDEPTAGLAQRETEAFGPLILQIRKELDAAMIVIEHDMPLIMGISDRVYCLEAGRVIASGDPASVRSDPAVIASYLGTDQRAIERSGAISE